MNGESESVDLLDGDDEEEVVRQERGN